MLFIKIAFYATLIPVVMVSTAVAAFIFKEVGWAVPWRWLCIINLISFVALLIIEAKK